MNKFVVIMSLFNLIIMHGSDTASSPQQPLLSQKNKQKKSDTNVPKKRQIDEEKKLDQRVLSSSKSPKKVIEKETVHDKALKLDPLARLKLALELCDFSPESIMPSSISPHTIDEMRRCADTLSTLVGENTLAKIVAWEKSIKVESPKQSKNENEAEPKKRCPQCVIL